MLDEKINREGRCERKENKRDDILTLRAQNFH